MRLPNDPTKFTSQFKYVEFARFIPKLNKVIRTKQDGSPVLFTWSEIDELITKYNSNGLYTSVFQYNDQNYDRAACLGPLYFDLDSDENPETARLESIRLVGHLLSYIPESAIRVYYSGQKGMHVECHPGNEQVLTVEDGYIKIEDLDPNRHHLVSYDKGKDRIRRLISRKNQSGKFSLSSRQYTGKLLHITVNGQTFKCTPNHHLTVSWNKRGLESYAVYLMRRGNHWRIGMTKMFSARGVPRIRVRMHEENADDIWILGLFDSENEALIYETLWSYKFGIPQIVFVPSRYQRNGLTDEQAVSIFEGLETHTKVSELFTFFGLDEDLPFRSKGFQKVTEANVDPLTKRFKIYASNLIPEFMEMPCDDGTMWPVWTDDISVTVSFFNGEVFNIAMEQYHHYIVNKVIVHNCEPIALGISSSDELAGVFRFIAADLGETLSLTSLDFNVYDLRRMWRIPNTRHHKSGLYKVECMRLLSEGASLDDIKKYSESPHELNIPEQTFNPQANQWYREYVYAYEKSKMPVKRDTDALARFLEQGSSNIRHLENDNRFFDKYRLLKTCTAIRDLEEKAREKHHLDHYERLFLCSILTYTPDAVQYLHEILQECSDYNFEVSNAHIEDWIRRREYDIGGRPFSCSKAEQVGISCSGCAKLEPKRKMQRLSDGKYIETEEFSSPSPVRLAYSTAKNYF